VRACPENFIFIPAQAETDAGLRGSSEHPWIPGASLTSGPTEAGSG